MQVPLYCECMILIARARADRAKAMGQPYGTAESLAYYKAITRLGKASWDLCPQLHNPHSQLRIIAT